VINIFDRTLTAIKIYKFSTAVTTTRSTTFGFCWLSLRV